jgi:plastocyanin
LARVYHWHWRRSLANVQEGECDHAQTVVSIDMPGWPVSDSHHARAALAADDVKTIEIVLNAQGKFVFAEPDAKINAGQSIRWVPKDADVPHHLVPDTANDALKDTGEFDSTNPPTQTFKSPGVIKYHCMIHPATMKGTITVK